MARGYLFHCNCCPAQVLQERETLPDGWIVVSTGGRQVDLCSAQCLELAIAGTAPQLTKLNPVSQAAPMSLPPATYAPNDPRAGKGQQLPMAKPPGSSD